MKIDCGFSSGSYNHSRKLWTNKMIYHKCVHFFIRKISYKHRGSNLVQNFPNTLKKLNFDYGNFPNECLDQECMIWSRGRIWKKWIKIKIIRASPGFYWLLKKRGHIEFGINIIKNLRNHHLFRFSMNWNLKSRYPTCDKPFPRFKWKYNHKSETRCSYEIFLIKKIIICSRYNYMAFKIRSARAFAIEIYRVWWWE